jgi:predicted transcriptional regulator
LPEDADLKKLVAKVAAAYFANSHVSPSEISTVIDHVATSLGSVGAPSAAPVQPPPETPRLTPAQIRTSITPEALISFEDNKPYRTLRRHLAVRGLTPDQYREKWGLPEEYPMVAPSYSAVRAQVARSIGLGGRALAAEKAPAIREGRKAAAPFHGSSQIALPAADVVRTPAAALVNPIQSTQPEALAETSPSSVEAVGPLLPAPAAAVAKLTSAQIERSITAEALISFEDGKPYKQLKRHLAARGMTPDEYRAKWGLPSDYPIVAANLSAARSAVAVRSGLGRRAPPPPGAAVQPATLTPVASSSAQAPAPLQQPPPEVTPPGHTEEPIESLVSEPATKPPKARIHGRLSLFRRRPETA